MTDNYYYITGNGNDFRSRLRDALDGIRFKETVMRLVFFVASDSPEDYYYKKGIIGEEIAGRFETSPPPWSCISQTPLDGSGIALEVQETSPGPDIEITHKSYNGIGYTVARTPGFKKLYLGGVTSESGGVSFREHCDAVFAMIEGILAREGMSPSDIVRQWNYIPGITGTENGYQHYQDFNDARSRFYDGAWWRDGYPAATGIGSSHGGLVIDLEAIKPLAEDAVSIRRIDNRLQVSAFAYSQKVLAGGSGDHRTTPKFERAKAVVRDGEGVIYISGTAAIRGEESLEGVGIEEQTRTTLENIGHLISCETLRESGIACGSNAGIVLLRVYVKNPEHMEKTEEIVSSVYPGIPALYLHADVCRDNLLVEIEGIAVMK